MKKILKNTIITILATVVIIAGAWMFKFNYLASLDWYDADGNKIESITK
jgi:hypothetical protein